MEVARCSMLMDCDRALLRGSLDGDCSVWVGDGATTVVVDVGGEIERSSWFDCPERAE
jgi:hypothetical protein